MSDPYVSIMGETGAQMYHQMERLCEQANLEVGRLRSELKHTRRDVIQEAVDYFSQHRRSGRLYSGRHVARLLQSWLDDEELEEAERRTR